MGNDVIDLTVAGRESNWQRPGYLSKICTPAEQALVAVATQPHQMVWWLWSCKEAAYKIEHRNTRERRYTPLRFICTLQTANETCMTGRVSCGQHVYYTHTVITGDCLHTWAVAQPSLFKLVAGITGLSAAVISAALRPDEQLQKDVMGVPVVAHHQDGRQPVSISHHGKYTALVRVLPGISIGQW
nr:4'-phosphopantetheinyl transferase superfamily protein [Chitinophaga nivalis]